MSGPKPNTVARLKSRIGPKKDFGLATLLH